MFKILYEDKKTRIGILKTKSSSLETPAFLPVATRLSTKLVSTKDLESLKIKALITNAFLTSLDPGIEVINSMNGLHNFMNFNGIIFTDSGGFQNYSGFSATYSDRGIRFQSPYDHSYHLLTPELSIQIQNRLDADVIMPLDHMSLNSYTKEQHTKAVEQTSEWLARCINAHKNKKQLLFGISQGGTYKDLRRKSLSFITSQNIQGVSIGGLGIGESPIDMMKVVSFSKSLIPKHFSVYLMGIGSPKHLLEAISYGVDIFDSCYPTRLARHCIIFTKKGQLKLDNQKNRTIKNPLEKDCKCPTCLSYSTSYLYHLYKIKEPLWKRLLTIHNLYFIQSLLEQAKEAIRQGKFEKFRKEYSKA